MLVVAVFVLSGCANKENVNNDNSAFRRPDFGQPEALPDITGLIKSITGNEVTILKVERPSRGEVSEGEQTESKDGSAPAMGSGGRIPGMGGGMRKTDPGEEAQAQMLEMMKSMSTGEEKVIIPVGIQMLKRDEAGEEKPEMVEASLADIKQDKMVQVWLDESATDRKIANFVMIMR